MIFGSRLFEKVLVVVSAVVALALVAALFSFERKMAKQSEMFYQLQAVRISANLYKAIQKKNPDNLETLITERFKFQGEEFSRPFLDMPYGSRRNFLVDPFGNKYRYNKGTGWVSSSTPGYEYW